MGRLACVFSIQALVLFAGAAAGCYEASIGLPPPDDQIETGVSRLPEGAELTLRVKSQQHLHALVIDATDIYWSTGPGVGTSPAAVWRTPRQGGEPVQLWSGDGRVHDLALDHANVYFVQSTGDHAPPGAVWRLAKAGGEAVALAEGVRGASALALDGEHVYFNQDMAGAYSVRRVAKQGGLVATVLGGIEHAWDLDVVGDWVIVSDTNQRRLLRVRRAGGAPELLASGLGGTLQVASHGTAVVFGVCPRTSCDRATLFGFSAAGPQGLFQVADGEHQARIAHGPGYLAWGGHFYSLTDGDFVDLLAGKPDFLATGAAGDAHGLFLGDFHTGHIYGVELEVVQD